MFVVTGADGKTGGAVARALLDQQHQVRVVLRPGRAPDAWQAAGAEVAVADLNDGAALAAAFTGARAAYVLNPPVYRVDDILVPARKAAGAYRSALAVTGVRAVALSSIGAQHPEGTGNIRTTHLLESALAPLGTTFVRAGNFMANWLSELPAMRGGVLPSFLQPLDRAIPTVAVEDIANVVVRELLRTDTRTVELAGPADCSPQQVAAAFATALGHPVRAEAIARERWFETLAAFGFPDAALANWVEMWEGFNNGHIGFEGTPERGRVTIEEFAAASTAVTAEATSGVRG